MSDADAADIYALRSNPEVNKYLWRKPAESEDEAKSFIQNINASIEKGHAFYWAICHKASQSCIGTICLYDINQTAKACEMGYELLPAYHGQGFMKESCLTVTDFVFSILKLENILASTHKDNQASIGLLNMLGFKPDLDRSPDEAELVNYCLQK